MHSKWSQHIKVKKTKQKRARPSRYSCLSLTMTETSRSLWHCRVVFYLVGTKAKLYHWQIACRSLNNVAVTSKRTLVALRVLRIKLCRTILRVRISIALTRNNSCTNIELKCRGSFFQELCFEAIFYWPFYFCMWEMYNLTFVNLKNFVLLYFWIPVSGFRIPDSGFRIPGFFKQGSRDDPNHDYCQFPWSQ